MSDRITPKPYLLPRPLKFSCDHHAVHVDEKTRSLECQKCGAVVEPFDYLMMFAKRQNRTYMAVKSLHRERDKLMAEVEDLKRQRRNLKAQISRAKKVHRG